MDSIPREICRDQEQALVREWRVTNAAAAQATASSAYASAGITGALSRSGHGLLVAPLQDEFPTVTLAKLDEEVQVGDQLFKLGTNVYLNNIVSPDGFLYLQQVTFDANIPTFWYEAGRFQLTKTVWLQPACNTTCIQYSVSEQSSPLNLTLIPLCDYRRADRTTAGSESWRFGITPLANGFQVLAHEHARPYRVVTDPPAQFTPLDLWYWRFQLSAEANTATDLYAPGLLRFELQPGNSVTVFVTTHDDDQVEWSAERSLAAAKQLAVPPTLPG